MWLKGTKSQDSEPGKITKTVIPQIKLSSNASRVRSSRAILSFMHKSIITLLQSKKSTGRLFGYSRPVNCHTIYRPVPGLFVLYMPPGN